MEERNINQSAVPAEITTWTKVKNFLLQEITVELTPKQETLAAFAEVDEMKKTAPDKDSKILMIYGPVWRIDMLNIIYSGQFHFSLLT